MYKILKQSDMMKEVIKEVLEYKKNPTFDYEIDSYQQIGEDEYIPTKQSIKLTDTEYYATIHDNSMKELASFSHIEPPDSDEESDSDYESDGE
jgi:hypothetical protein